MSGQRHAPSALYPRERPGTHRTVGWVGPKASLDGRKISPPPGFDPRTVQPVVSRYTDWATRPTTITVLLWNVEYCLPTVGQDSSVCITTRYVLDGPGIESRWGRVFRTRPGRPWSPPSLLYNAYRVSFTGFKAAGAWLWPPTPSTPEVKEREELYLCSPSGPSWPVRGWTLPLPLLFTNDIASGGVGDPARLDNRSPSPMIIKQITRRSPTALPSIRRTYSPKEPITNVTILYPFWGGGCQPAQGLRGPFLRLWSTTFNIPDLESSAATLWESQILILAERMLVLRKNMHTWRSPIRGI